MRRWIVGGGGGILALVVSALLYLAAWPTPIRPVAWQSPAAPKAEGPWAPNRALADVERYPVPDGDFGPEDVHVWRGRLVGGTAGGRIVAWPLEGGEPEVIAETGGRPLGLHEGIDGSLFIADAQRGLMRLTPDGELTVICDEVLGGYPIVFADDVDVDPNGHVWFTDASVRFGQPDWKLDILESAPNGRLLRWHDVGPGCEEMVPDLHFANGVAVAEDGSFVLINETSRYRVLKLWVGGERSGAVDVLIDNLPGFPDGISRGEGDVFWIAIASPRNAVVDATAGRPFLRQVIARLPAWLQPAPERHPYVIAIDGQGTVLATLQDPDGATYGMVTSAQQHGDWLYLGSLQEPAAARVRVPASLR